MSANDKLRREAGRTLIVGTRKVMSVDGTGIIKPLQPAFQVYRRQGADCIISNTAEQRIAFECIRFDIGSNTSNCGLFRAPLCGRYAFSSTVRYDGASNASSYLRLYFAINGCKLNKKQVNEGGNDQSFFHKNFKMTFTGHFHEPATYKSGKKEITYIGCPYHLDRNDSNGDRGVIVLDFETQKWERVFSKNALKYIVIPFGTDLTKVEIPNNIIDIHVNVKHDFDSKKN
jgi:hypothetical protein